MALRIKTSQWPSHPISWKHGLSCLVCLILLFAEKGLSLDAVSKVADGELRACQAVTVDHSWAVGDNGLILATSDAGKTWNIQHQRSKTTHHAVCFVNESVGWVLGGTIEPYSFRSVGTVLKTLDGGRNWQNLTIDLPRIIGAQLIANNHILAWGDWSDIYQSALFESTDGGLSWAARPTPSSHLQCAASGPNGVLVCVDRTGKIYRTNDGLEYQPVHLPHTPFEPIRFCKWMDGVWWLGGDAGQIYRSSDATQWQRVDLPGNASDLSLFSLRDLASAGNYLWIVGQPGNVVWVSEDLGIHWTTRHLSHPGPNNAISALNSDVLLACGPLAKIFGSRNGGKAWWTQHQSGTRDAALNISSTTSGAAWDYLTHVVQEYKRNASVIVLHDQAYELKTSHCTEVAARFEIAGKSVGLSQARVLPSMPVSHLYSGVRPTDLNYYLREHASVGVEHSPLLKRLVTEIRASRPDIIVAPCAKTGTLLESQTAQAVEEAVRLAANKEYRVYSVESGVPEEAWQTQRIIARGMRPGLQYAPGMILKSSNRTLGSATASIKPLIEGLSSLNTLEPRYAYSVAGTKTASIREPLDGVLLDAATQSSDRARNNLRWSELKNVCQWFDWKQDLKSEFGNPLTPDRVWDSKLREMRQNLPAETVSPILLEIALESRRNGDWNRWFGTLEYLLELDSKSPMAEAAFFELMGFTGSQEVQRLLAQQIQAIEHRVEATSTTQSTSQQASPFAKAQRDSTPVQSVSFNHAIRRIPIATHRDLDEFSRLLSRWPDTFQSRRSNQRWGWLIASRYRAMQIRNDHSLQVNLGRPASFFWPPQNTNLSSWLNVGVSERSLSTSEIPNEAISNPIQTLTTTQERPYLDGKSDEAFWANAMRVELRDPWSRNPSETSSLHFARDEEFLYIFSRSPLLTSVAKPPPSMMLTPNNKTPSADVEKRRDKVSADSDHFKLRLDIDRDYTSWFEFAWSSSGDTCDSCNDMSLWNPTWYVATSKDDTAWTAEIAIPLAELFGADEGLVRQGVSQTWAINAVRSIPSVATHSIAPTISDRMTDDSWLFVGPKSSR